MRRLEFDAGDERGELIQHRLDQRRVKGVRDLEQLHALASRDGHISNALNEGRWTGDDTVLGAIFCGDGQLWAAR